LIGRIPDIVRIRACGFTFVISRRGGIDDEQNSATLVRLQLRNFIEYGVTQVEVKLA
jgi:hypothetical protein